MKFNKLASYVLLIFAASTCFAQMYTVTDLGTLGGTSSEATGINASGQVAGNSMVNNSVSSQHAFRTAPHGVINSATDDIALRYCNRNSTDYACFVSVRAYGINDLGQVVGGVTTLAGDFLAFRTPPNSPIRTSPNGSNTFYPDVLPCNTTRSVAINRSGRVLVSYVGQSFLNSPPRPWSPFLCTNFQPGENLGSLVPGELNTVGSDINDLGQAVGGSAGHAFRTAPNRPINPATDDLGTLGGSSSNATAINASGQVVGLSTTTDDAFTHVFRTAPNSAIDPSIDDLGPGTATDIDSYGQVIGGLLYSNGEWHDLNDLIAANSGCDSIGAVKMNDTGEIAGNATCNGEQHAVRIDPIYRAFVQQPINADGSSVFNSKSGVIPINFRLTRSDKRTCDLLSATISVVPATSGTRKRVLEGKYTGHPDSGPDFRISSCHYIYNLAAASLSVGTYRADISVSGIMVGHAVFAIR